MAMRLSQQQKIKTCKREFFLSVFILTEHCMAAWRYEIFLFNNPPTLEEKLEEKFSAVSPRGHVISCLYIFQGSANYVKLVKSTGLAYL